ncbi:MAG: DegT/DnrJ/EryC1/StrS family aminotransferase [Acidimicrobiia bacterium]|nr:DegT/DnrJ/EryC1/StrS family aminotransferase [Acidimicrobiia bacterium]
MWDRPAIRRWSGALRTVRSLVSAGGQRSYREGDRVSLERIPMLDLQPELTLIADGVMAAWSGVLKSGQFINGPNVRAFEAEVAAFLGADHAVGVNSGTDALVIGLRSLGIGAGDEVITTPFTFFATGEAVSVIGATPVFVDIDPDTFNIDPEAIEAAVTDRTKAIIPVHLFGQPADMGAILDVARRHDLRILEDVAQAFGGKFQDRLLGTLGDIGAFSFFPSKNLGAYGDGGLITTNDDGLAETARMLRAHGGKNKYANELIGYNSRLDEIQAALLRVKLPLLSSFNDGRKQVARHYNERLATIAGLRVPVMRADDHVYHQYTVRILNGGRDAVQQSLAESGIASTVYYPTPLHKLPVYTDMGGTFPNAAQAAEEVLSLPIWPQMDERTQDRVCDAVAEAVHQWSQR